MWTQTTTWDNLPTKKSPSLDETLVRYLFEGIPPKEVYPKIDFHKKETDEYMKFVLKSLSTHNEKI